MSRNRNRNEPIIVNENNDIQPRGITFNYTENFNRIIELSTENYNGWRSNVLYLLTINNLEKYVAKETVKKIRKRDIPDDIDDYLEDKFDNNLVYDKETTLLDIKNDVIVKWIIINSLGEQTRKIIEGHGKTAFQVWNTLEKSFTLSPERQKLNLKTKIDNLKYSEDQDINIFIAILQNYLDELENVDHDISDNVKAGILNRALPDNLRFINVFQFKNNWPKLCEYIKNVISDIVFSNMRESITRDENNKQIFSTTSNTTAVKM